VNVLAIDPGTTHSQYLVWNGERVVEQGHLPNGDLVSRIAGFKCHDVRQAVIEMVASYGMAVGKEVFETVYWIGRFDERLRGHGYDPHRMVRLTVKMHLCHTAKAKDANIRQALIDRFGGKEAAIGRKATPGPLYGVSSHAWAALALAITFAETQKYVDTCTHVAPTSAQLER
jgi:hypothetical protein